MRSPEAPERLNTWAEIAAYIGRDARTAKRYEAQRGLPVRRLPGSRSTVFALTTELDAWRAGNVHEPTPQSPDEPPAEATVMAPLAAPTSRRPTWAVWLLAGAAGVAVVGGGAAALLGVRSAHAEPESFVVAALQNDTGDAVFDRLIPRLIQIDLTQSPRLQVTDDSQVSQALSLMERPKDTILTPAVAREVCVRNNGGVLVAPGAALVGSRYVLTMLASDCVSGRPLSQEREVVDSKNELPQALDWLATRTRRKLGESQASVTRFNLPILSARTASFDALRAYSEGVWLSKHGRDLEAVPLFHQAIGIDGNFGLAWLGLAQTLFHARQWREDAEAMAHAYALRSSMSERDQLFTAYRYHYVVEKDFVAALNSLKALAMIYPDDAPILNSLSFLQFDLGRFDDAIATAEQATHADPRSSAARFNLMRASTRSGHAARAKVLGEAAAKAGIVDSRVYEQRILAEIELGDTAQAKRLVDAVVGTPLERDALLQYSSVFGDGRAREFDALVERADILGRTQGLRMDWPAVIAGLADSGADALARRRLAVVEPDLRVAKFHRAQALVGDPAQEEADLARDEARWPKDTLRSAEYAPEARAILALRRGDPQAAVRAVGTPDPYEFRTLEFPYIRAQALLAAGNGPGAAAEFLAVLAHPGWSNWPQYGLSHLGLARALRLERDIDGSRREYDLFLRAWRAADPDMPQLGRARRERAALGPASAG